MDPEAVEKFRENTARANLSVPFGKMTPSASDIILVNTLIGTVAKGSVLQMQLKDFNITSATSTCKSTSVLQPKPCVTNTNISQANSTNTVNNTDSAVDLKYKSTVRLTPQPG